MNELHISPNMKTHFMKFALILTCIAFIFSCESKTKSIDTSRNITPKVEKKITVYGSINCDHCIEFREKMDSVKLKYEFKDAETNEKYYNELLLKIQQANYPGYVSFPVLLVGDQLLVRPNFVDFMKVVNQ